MLFMVVIIMMTMEKVPLSLRVYIFGITCHIHYHQQTIELGSDIHNTKYEIYMLEKTKENDNTPGNEWEHDTLYSLPHLFQ